MAEIIVSMHAAHRSGKDVVDGFLSRPMVAKERPAVVRVHGYRGLDDGQRAVTRRFAQEGFVCLSPDLFSIIPRTRMRRIARRQQSRS
jgi:dienelactone hydrolase